MPRIKEQKTVTYPLSDILYITGLDEGLIQITFKLGAIMVGKVAVFLGNKVTITLS